MKAFLVIMVAVYFFIIWIIMKPKKRAKTELVLYIFINNQKTPVTVMQLKIKQFVETQLGLVKKGTDEKIEATFSNIEIISSDEGVFTVGDVDEDGELDLTGVGEGAAQVHVKADVQYIDPENGQTVNTTKEKDVDVFVSFKDGVETELTVSFTPPENVPEDQQPS